MINGLFKVVAKSKEHSKQTRAWYGFLGDWACERGEKWGSHTLKPGLGQS